MLKIFIPWFDDGVCLCQPLEVFATQNLSEIGVVLSFFFVHPSSRPGLVANPDSAIHVSY